MKVSILNTLRSIESDERIDLKVILVFLVFVSITRMILETLLGSSDYIIFTNFPTFLLVFSFYSLGLVSYTFFLSICSGKKSINIARILTPFLLVALLVPIIDYFLTGYPVSYQMSAISDFDILRISSNNPIGESVILWALPILAALYVFFERKSVKRSIITFIVIFFVPIFLATDIADFLGLGRSLYFLYATVASIVFLLLMFYIQDVEKFGQLFMRFYERMNRVVLYIIVFVFGIATAGSIFDASLFGIYIIVLLIISFIAMCMNDYFDFSIDKANKKNNLLNVLSREELKNIILISFLIIIPFLSFIFEGVKNVVFVYYMVSMLSLIILYSYKNFLKHFFPFNYVADALSYGITFMAGRSIFLVHSQYEFAYFILVTILFLLLIPMKDYGDYKGDKKIGVKTLYTLLGFERAFRVCKLLLLIAFIIASFYFLLISPLIGFVNIVIFYAIPSAIIIPSMVIRFKKTENFEKSLWLLDVLFFAYLIPLLLL
ncbi:MAG: hypothetical protein GTN76_11830 [Candidatus Aenigmarchaeota archaeon]|nr:hypothetical protein [Candidatus Aenigmarchaeota archaeon]